MFALSRLLLICCAITIGTISGTELLDRLDQDAWWLTIDPIERAQTLADQERWAEAKLLAEFVVNNPLLGDVNQAQKIIEKADLELNSYWGMARRFTEGALSGEPKDGISMLGSLSLDLFVIGDIRDLAVQGWKEIQYGEGDEIILALSAIGLTTTLAPQFDWAPALMKALKRAGALSRRFLTGLSRVSRAAMKTGKFEPVTKIATDLAKTTKRLGPGPVSGVMKSVDSAEDLAKIAKAAELNPKGTYAITTLFGKNGVKRINKDGKNVSKLISSIKVSSRIGKATKKWTGNLSTPWLSGLFGISVLLALLALRPRRRKLKHNQIPVHERVEPKLG